MTLTTLSNVTRQFVAKRLQTFAIPAIATVLRCHKSTVPVDHHHPYQKRLTEETMLQGLRTMEYEVRGRVVIKADEMNDNLASGQYPFDHIVYTNIGNPHGVGQKPLTWPRQVIALCDLPYSKGLGNPETSELFPKDVVDRAKEIKHFTLSGKGTGAYTHSQGCMGFRKEIAEFLEKRDDAPADPEHIFMTNGASAGIDMILTSLIADKTCGVMIPIPQYPLYSATIALRGGQQVGYFLDEESGWQVKMDDMEKAIDEAKSKGINVNSFVLINPGNPTGEVLSRETIYDVLRFCHDHNLVLLADEVYQENVYGDNCEFVSCKKAAAELGYLDNDAIELASFHSSSKGLFGECGRRGGYMELVGFDPAVESHIYKLASSFLCPNVDGQVMTSLMCRGPEPGTLTHMTHEKEISEVFESLKRRSKIVTEGLNSIPGFSCQPAQGAMYCFPRVDIPPRAIQEAETQGITPDALYSLSLLESTGICVVPGSGFGQKPGRYGFRTTFLPPENEMERAIDLFARHHEEFCEKYA